MPTHCQRVAHALPTLCPHVANALPTHCPCVANVLPTRCQCIANTPHAMISLDKINVVNALPTCCQRISNALPTRCQCIAHVSTTASWLDVAQRYQLVVTVHQIRRVGQERKRGRSGSTTGPRQERAGAVQEQNRSTIFIFKYFVGRSRAGAGKE